MSVVNLDFSEYRRSRYRCIAGVFPQVGALGYVHPPDLFKPVFDGISDFCSGESNGSHHPNNLALLRTNSTAAIVLFF